MDRENTIRQIEKCINDTSCIGCPYEKSLVCRHHMLADALALLKEPEQDRIEIAHEMVSNSILMYQGKELVRCKDCKWFIKKFENEGRCIKHDNDYHDPDWFCADGEREEGEVNDSD